MRGLLLAGLRLASGNPVAATRVGGLSLLERAAFVARDAGVTAAVVVAERPLQAFLRAAVERDDLGVELTYADPLTERDTILSWLEGEEPVAVVRADVAHTRHASPALRDAEPGEILVDEREGPLRGAEGLRLATGPTWVGLALLPPSALGSLIDGLGREPTRGDLLGLDVLVAVGRAQTVPVTGLPWQAVRSAAETRAAERLLLGSLVQPTEGWVAVHVDRPLSARVTRLLADAPVHPDHASLAVLLLGLAGCAAVASGGRYLLPLLGAFLVRCAAVLAGVDGGLARLRYQGSSIGAWLDTAGGDITTLACIMAVTANLARFGNSAIWTGMGVCAAVCTVIAVAVSYTYLISTGSSRRDDFPTGLEPGGSATTPARKVWGVIGQLSQRDAQTLVLLVGAAVGLLQIATVCYFVGAVATCVATVRRRLQLRRETTAEHGTALTGTDTGPDRPEPGARPPQ